jgi:hypothetical protein
MCLFRISTGTPAIISEISYDFPQSLQANHEIVYRLSYSRFLPNPLQFITYISYHSTLCSLATDSVVEWIANNNRCLVTTLSFSLFLLLPFWSIGHPWNALFHFSFLILRQSVGLLGRGIRPSQGRYLHKHRINKEKHPCFEWDSNPWSQRSSGRRQFCKHWFWVKRLRS